MPNTTSNFGLLQPLVNNATDADLWGGYLNTTIGDVDALLLTCLNFTPVTQTSTFTATIPTAGTITTGSARTLQRCNATSGAITANLPAASTASGMIIAFKKTDSSTNAVIVTGHSTDTIDGSNTYNLSAQYNYVILSCDGTGWDILSSTPPAIQAATTTVAGILMTATAAIALAGTDTATALTAAAFAGNKSLASSGYYKFPGGLIIQWGTTGSVTSGGSLSTNFPIAFPNSAYNAFITGTAPGSSGGATAAVTSLSVNSFTINNNINVNQGFYWFALGN